MVNTNLFFISLRTGEVQLGFDRIHSRGWDKTDGEWSLTRLVHNIDMKKICAQIISKAGKLNGLARELAASYNLA